MYDLQVIDFTRENNTYYKMNSLIDFAIIAKQQNKNCLCSVTTAYDIK